MQTFIRPFRPTDYSQDYHTMFTIGNSVDDSPIPYTNPVEIPFEFLYAKGSWVFSQSPNRRVDFGEDGARNFVQLFLSPAVKKNFVSQRI